MPLTIYCKEQITFQLHVQRFLELFHWKVMLGNSTEIHCNSSHSNIFWCFPVILCESYYFIMLIFEIQFLLYFWNFMVFPSCVFIIFRVYLNFLSNSSNNSIFFVSYLLKFCCCHSAIFATAPSLASLRFSPSIDNFKHVLDKCT